MEVGFHQPAIHMRHSLVFVTEFALEAGQTHVWLGGWWCIRCPARIERVAPPPYRVQSNWPGRDDHTLAGPGILLPVQPPSVYQWVGPEPGRSSERSSLYQFQLQLGPMGGGASEVPSSVQRGSPGFPPFQARPQGWMSRGGMYLLALLVLFLGQCWVQPS